MTKKEIQGPFTSHFKSGDIICSTGQENYDLYLIHKGRLMVFVTEGTKVTPISYLEEGEYIGELSFFDQKPRSAHVVCVEDASLVTIPISELGQQFPEWLQTIALSIVSKLRSATDLIRKKGIRKQNVESIKPLTIERQRFFYQAVVDFRQKNGLENL